MIKMEFTLTNLTFSPSEEIIALISLVIITSVLSGMEVKLEESFNISAPSDSSSLLQNSIFAIASKHLFKNGCTA